MSLLFRAPRQFRLPILLSCAIFVFSCPGQADNLNGALLRAFRAHPALNAQRHGTLASRELLPQARAKYLPKISATADGGLDTRSGAFNTFGSAASPDYLTRPHGYGLQVTQTIFDGNRTSNGVLAAGSQAEGAAQTLRTVEQTTLFDAVSAYTAVLRDRDLVELNKRSTAFLRQQLRLVSERHAFGDVTRADVAQASARLAGGVLRLNAAEQQLRASGAVYVQVTGVAPGQLTLPRPIDPLVPQDLDSALAITLRSHPAILAAQNALDAALSQVDIVNGEFLPTVSVTAALSKRYDSNVRGDNQLGQSVIGQISIPIYDGGATYSRTRQAKEVAGQRRLDVDAVREQVRATLVTNWGQFQSSKAQVLVAAAQFDAGSRELSDATEQYRYGQKSLTDVLNAQQDLLDAGTSLIIARYDRVVATFAVVRSIGQLTLDRLPGDLDDHRPAPTARFPAPIGRTPSPVVDGIARSCAADNPLTCVPQDDDLALRRGIEPTPDAPSAQAIGLRTDGRGDDAPYEDAPSAPAIGLRTTMDGFPRVAVSSPMKPIGWRRGSRPMLRR